MEGLFVLFHSPGRAWQAGVPYAQQPGIIDHIGFMRSLAERELMLLGGPFGDGAPDGLPVGMAVIRAASVEEAELIAGEDRSVASG
jgi:hypothetical protein